MKLVDTKSTTPLLGALATPWEYHRENDVRIRAIRVHLQDGRLPYRAHVLPIPAAPTPRLP